MGVMRIKRAVERERELCPNAGGADVVPQRAPSTLGPCSPLSQGLAGTAGNPPRLADLLLGTYKSYPVPKQGFTKLHIPEGSYFSMRT